MTSHHQPPIQSHHQHQHPQTASRNIPTTPNNQKRPPGPIPSLISTLRTDNHDQLTRLLTLDPYTDLPPPPVHPTTASSSAASASIGDNSLPPRVSHRQRLIFASESLRTLLLYHVLPDPETRNEPKKKIRKKKNNPRRPQPQLTAREEALGLTSMNRFGIVGTRVLFPSPPAVRNDDLYDLHDSEPTATTTATANVADDDRTNRRASQSSSEVTGTVYDPHVPSCTSGYHFEPSNTDRERDTSDGASVIVYFVRPTPSHVRTVCQDIKRRRREEAISSSSGGGMTSNPFGDGGSVGSGSQPRRRSNRTTVTPVIRYRVVFLPRTSSLSKRIFSDEDVSFTDESDYHPTVSIGGSSASNHTNTLGLPNVRLHTLDIDLVPLEDDVLTCLELSSLLRETCVEGVTSDHVTTVAQSLVKIQDVVGLIPRVQSLGDLGRAAVKRMMGLMLEEWDPLRSKEEMEEDVRLKHQQWGGGGIGGDTNGGGKGTNNIGGDIAAMIVLDRRVDMVTPMLTPLTYEGLLDDVLRIDSGMIEVDADIIDPKDPDAPPEEDDHSNSNPFGGGTDGDERRETSITLPLNDLDTLYVEVRDQHVEKFGTFLQNQAKALKESHTNFSDKNKDLTELHQFVKQIPIFTQSLKSLENHIHLAELVKKTSERSEFRRRWQTERSMVENETCYDVLEDLIASQYPPFRLLRLLCLQSLTGGGLKASKFDSLRREVIQTYGYEFLFVLQNLERLGLLKKRESMWMETASPFTTVRKQFVLINADVDPLDPDDVSFVSSGYAPISARIVQTAINGWGGKEEALKCLPGKRVDIRQRYPPEDFDSALKREAGPSLGILGKQLLDSRSGGGNAGNGLGDNRKPVLLVYFVGGVTYMEIAAMRFLSKRSSFPYNILCCTTKIINGSTLLQSLS